MEENNIYLRHIIVVNEQLRNLILIQDINIKILQLINGIKNINIAILEQSHRIVGHPYLHHDDEQLLIIINNIMDLVGQLFATLSI